jgi:hypothetical protein
MMNDEFDDQNLELGYYQVGEVIHTSKVRALIDATERNMHPEWKFNPHIFDYYNWNIEPAESLYELYRQRAVQIRQKYDYVMLLYSAGADSQTMLDSFLDNGLHVDEILVLWPKSMEKLYTPDNTNFDPLNTLSEWDFTVKPKLDWLAKHHPKIKITVHDWAEDVLDYKVEDGYVMERGHNVTPFYLHRNSFYHIPSVQKVLEKYSNPGIILGIDKPRICWKDDEYRLYFLDIIPAGMGPQNDRRLRKSKLHLEFFYWSPDGCKILAKQAHALVKFFESVPSFKHYITWPITNSRNRTWYESTVKAVIYPRYDLGLFQANKFEEMSVGYDQFLFALGKKDQVMGITNENFSFLQRLIDPKFFNEVHGKTVFTGFVAGMYPIKPVV